VYAICVVFFFFAFEDLLLQYVNVSLQSCANLVGSVHFVLIVSSEKLSFVCLNGAVFQNRLVLLLIECTGLSNSSWGRSIKSIESVALDFRHNEEVGDAKTACSKGPQQASKWCCDESALIC
jgi:hypothetical protein